MGIPMSYETRCTLCVVFWIVGMGLAFYISVTYALPHASLSLSHTFTILSHVGAALASWVYVLIAFCVFRDEDDTTQ